MSTVGKYKLSPSSLETIAIDCIANEKINKKCTFMYYCMTSATTKNASDGGSEIAIYVQSNLQLCFYQMLVSYMVLLSFDLKCYTSTKPRTTWQATTVGHMMTLRPYNTCHSIDWSLFPPEPLP